MLLSASCSRRLLLGLLLAFLFFYRLADRGLWSSHEGRAAQNAQTMLTTGAWGLPRLFDGHPELQKPPLYYWLVAGYAWMRGRLVDGWAVRLPAALSATGCVLAVLRFLSGRGRPLAGWLAALMLATAIHFTWLARVGRIDMPLTLTVTSAILGGWSTSRWGQGLAYLAVAAGLLLKGPIGAVLPAAVLTACRFLDGHNHGWRPWRSSLLWGVPLVLLLTLPWYCWVHATTNGDFSRSFFGHHNLARGLGSADDLKVHPWWFYGPRLLVDWLPWSPVLVMALWWTWRNQRWRTDSELRLGLAWLGSILLVLSCVSFKRADYLLPAYPGAALVLGCVGERWYHMLEYRRGLMTGFALILLGCLLGWGIYLEYVEPVRNQAFDQRPFAQEVRRLVPTSTHVLFFRTEQHDLAFHIGPPQSTFLEWENLDVWAGKPGTHYLLMPPQCLAEWSQHLSRGRLVTVLHNTDLVPGLPKHAHLVLVRTMPSKP